MKPVALITGATAGIGEATAQALAQDFALVVCGRREERLAALKKKLASRTDVATCAFDVRDRAAAEATLNALPAAFQSIDVLINNAGNAHGFSFIHEGDVADWDAMIDINVKGLLYVSKWAIPGMVARQRGHIVNIGSIAGVETYPRGNVYCASKAAVAALTEGMRLDLNPFGIRVTEIKPGLVETEFSQVRFKGDETRAKTVYEGYQPLTAQDIAEVVAFAVTRPPHVVLADVMVLPTAQASATVVRRQ